MNGDNSQFKQLKWHVPHSAVTPLISSTKALYKRELMQLLKCTLNPFYSGEYSFAKINCSCKVKSESLLSNEGLHVSSYNDGCDVTETS